MKEDCVHNKAVTKKGMNKAGYTAQDAPSTRLTITGDGRTDGRTSPLLEIRRRI